MVAGAEKQRQEAKSKQYNQQPAKSNVPDWVEADYKHEATAEEQAKLDELKKITNGGLTMDVKRKQFLAEHKNFETY